MKLAELSVEKLVCNFWKYRCIRLMDTTFSINLRDSSVARVFNGVFVLSDARPACVHSRVVPYILLVLPFPPPLASCSPFCCGVTVFVVGISFVCRYYLRCVAFAYYLPAYVFMLFSIDYLLAQVRKKQAPPCHGLRICCSIMLWMKLRVEAAC